QAGRDDLAMVLYDSALESARDRGDGDEIALVAGALALVHERRGAGALARRYATMASGGVAPPDASATGERDRQRQARYLGAALGVAVFCATWLALPALGAA